MERDGLSEDEAFKRLRKASQLSGKPLKGRCLECDVRRARWNVARRRGAMVVPRQGRRERSYRSDTGATRLARASSAALPPAFRRALLERLTIRGAVPTGRRQCLELIARRSMPAQKVGVAPVLRQLALEVGDGSFLVLDVGLHHLEGGLVRRLRWSHLGLLRHLRLGVFRSLRALFAAADQLRPAALVRAEVSVLDRQRPAERPRRAARDRERQARRSRGRPPAQSRRAPHGSRGRDGLPSARRGRGSSHRTRRRSRGPAADAPRQRARSRVSTARPSPRRGSGRAGSARTGAEALWSPARSRDYPALVQFELLLGVARGLDAVLEPHSSPAFRTVTAAELRSRAASSCPSRSGRRARRARRVQARSRPRRGAPCRLLDQQAGGLTTVRLLRGGFRKSKPIDRFFVVRPSSVCAWPPRSSSRAGQMRELAWACLALLFL